MAARGSPVSDADPSPRRAGAEGRPSRAADRPAGTDGAAPAGGGAWEPEDSLYDAPVAVRWVDANGTVLRANRFDLALLGFTVEELVGRNLRDLLVDPTVAEGLLGLLARGEPLRDQAAQIRCKDGTVKHVRIGWDVRRSGDGVLHARLFTQDVSENVRMGTALRDNEERFRMMVEGVRDYAIHTIGPDGTITSWNAGAQRLHGFSAEEILGRDLACLYLPADRSRRLPERLLREAAEKGESHQEGWRLRQDGSRFWADSVLTALRDEQGRLRGFTRLARDVTGRMQTEVTRRRSMELEAENRRLVDAWRLQAEFLSSMSRELRTPLGAALAAAERLREAESPPLSEEQRAHLDDVWGGLRHVLRSFDEVFDVVRLDSGSLELRTQRVNLARLAQDAREVLRGHAAEKRVSVEIEPGPTPPEIEGDPVLLKLVFHNLLWAAIRSAWPDGMVPVYVSPEGPDAFRVEVVDEGLDRPMDEPGGEGSRGGEEAAAAGLAEMRRAVTKRIVEAHGGRVGSRELPAGDRVHFVVLPRVARPLATAGTPALAPGRSASDAQERAILVVEDEAASRAWLAWTLSNAGWDVVTAAGAEDALAYGRDRAFQAVAVGLLLRSALAADVVRRLRSGGLHGALDALLVTVPGEIAGVAGVAVDDVLASPIRTDALFAALDRCDVRPGAEPSVLVLEADEARRDAALASLRVLGYASVGALDAEDALRIAAVAPPEAVLLGTDAATGGFEFLRHFRRMPGGESVPVVLLSPDVATPHAVRAAQTAAQAHVLTCAGGRARVLDELDARLARTGRRDAP